MIKPTRQILYNSLFALTILSVTCALFPKIAVGKGGLDKLLVGACSEKRRLGVLSTSKKGGYFVMGFLFVLFFWLAPHIHSTTIRGTDYEIPWSNVFCLLALALCIVYPICNLARHANTPGVPLRDTSFSTNLFDFQLGMWCSCVFIVVALAPSLHKVTKHDHTISMLVMAALAMLVSLGILIASAVLLGKKGVCDSCSLSEANCNHCPNNRSSTCPTSTPPTSRPNLLTGTVVPSNFWNNIQDLPSNIPDDDGQSA